MRWTPHELALSLLEIPSDLRLGRKSWREDRMTPTPSGSERITYIPKKGTVWKKATHVWERTMQCIHLAKPCRGNIAWKCDDDIKDHNDK